MMIHHHRIQPSRITPIRAKPMHVTPSVRRVQTKATSAENVLVNVCSFLVGVAIQMAVQHSFEMMRKIDKLVASSEEMKKTLQDADK